MNNTHMESKLDMTPAVPRTHRTHRIPVLMLLNTSGNMAGETIRELDAGLQKFLKDTAANDAVSTALDLEVIAFADRPKTVLPFTPVCHINGNAPAALQANGSTNMGRAMQKALYDLRQRGKEYKQNGIASYKPWVILFTDGCSNDDPAAAAEKLRSLSAQDKINYQVFEIGRKRDHEAVCKLLPSPSSPASLTPEQIQGAFGLLLDMLAAKHRVNSMVSRDACNIHSGKEVVKEPGNSPQIDTPADNDRKDHDMNTQWHGHSVSIPGSGHIRRGIPCQDASGVILEGHPSVIVCDGRGSASLSHFGAQGAIKAFRTQCAIFSPLLDGVLDSEEAVPEMWTKFCRIMYRTLMQVKLELAAEHNCPEKEFDFTVAFAIAGKKHIGCFQVGDGTLVLSRHGEPGTVFMPEKGEYANQTHFLRPGGEVRCDFQSALLPAEDVDGICATSDGPEHLMFQLATMTPGKVFRHLFADLTDAKLTEQDIRDYLTRREWDNDPRGTDDRSIAILGRYLPVREEVLPPPVEKVSPESEMDEPMTEVEKSLLEEKEEPVCAAEAPIMAEETVKQETPAGETVKQETPAVEAVKQETPAVEAVKQETAVPIAPPQAEEVPPSSVMEGEKKEMDSLPSAPAERKEFRISRLPFPEKSSGKKKKGTFRKYRVLQYGRDLCLILTVSGLLSCALQIHEQKLQQKEHHHETKEMTFRLRKLLQGKKDPNSTFGDVPRGH